MSMLDQQTLNDFKDKEYAHEYMEEIINTYIATQIKTLREQNDWTQTQLAEKAEMLQPRIPILENVNNSSLSLETLRKLARAFDLVLCVSFENFGRALPLINRLDKESLRRTPREKDLFPEPIWMKDKAVLEDKTFEQKTTIQATVKSESQLPAWAVGIAVLENAHA